MGRVFIDGFESYGIDLWDWSNDGAGAYSVQAGLDGSYCLRCTGDEGAVYKDITLASDLYFSVLYKTSSSSASSIISFWNGATLLLSIVRENYNVVAYRGGTMKLATGSETISNYTAYRIEVRYNIHDTTGRIQVKVDGVTDIDFTGDTKPGTDTQMNRVRLGWDGTRYGYAYFDNFIIDDASFPGRTKIQSIPPIGAGNAAQWTPSSGANWQCVDERPPSSSDYVAVNAVDQIDTYQAGDLSGEINSVVCVQVQAVCKEESPASPQNLNLAIRSGGTDYFSGDKLVPDDYSAVSHLWITDPNTAAAWLETNVNAIEIGVKSKT